MKRTLAVALASLLLCSAAYPRQSGSSHRLPAYSRTHRASAVARDRRGRLKRSESAKRDFDLQTGFPHGRPGSVVDHVVPLACGGADAPSNMQWQTTEEAKGRVLNVGLAHYQAKAKDRIE